MKQIDHDVLNFIRSWPLEFGVTRAVIAGELGIPRTTVFDILMRLLQVGLVKRTSRPQRRGRPHTYWSAKI